MMGIRYDKRDLTFAAIIIIAHLFFFVLAALYTRIYMGDSFEYIYEAYNIKQLGFLYSGNPALPIEVEYMTQRQPIYPLLLLLVYTFSASNWAVLIVQNVLSIFNILYTRKLLLRLGYNKKYDWLLLTFIIAYPSQFINANTIDPDILLQTCTILYFGAVLNLFRHPDLRNAAYSSLWLIAGLFVKPVLYPFVAIHAVVLIYFSVRKKLQVQRMAIVAIAPLCAVLLYNYWNFNRTGKFHFSSNQAFNAIYYFDAYYTATQGADSASRFINKERNDINKIQDFAGRYDAANKRGIELLKQNFVPYMWYHTRSAARIFIDPGKAEIDLFTGKLTYGTLYSGKGGGFSDTLKTQGWKGGVIYARKNPSLLFVILILLCNVVRCAGILLFAIDKKIPLWTRSLVGILLLYFSMTAGPIANTRYFLPVSLIAIGAATLGISNRRSKTR